MDRISEVVLGEGEFHSLYVGQNHIVGILDDILALNDHG